jgi:hypothetical protein
MAEDKVIKVFIGDASTLSDIIPKLKIDGLRKLKEHKDEKIKQLVTVELAKSGELNDNELNVLINDSNDDVRYWGYRSLINRGKKFNIEEVIKNWPLKTPRYPSILTWYSYKSNRLEELKIEILKTYSIEDLTKALTWLAIERELIYLAIGLCKGHEFLGQVRNDLDNKFARIKDVYGAKLNELKIQLEKTDDKTNLNVVLTLIDDFNKDTIYGENVFTKSTLKILIEYGKKEDIRFAKQFMTSEEPTIKALATKLFVNLASKDDISMLVDIAINNAGDISNKASQKALSLCDDSSVLETFLKSDNRELIKLCLKEKLNKGQFLEKEKVEKLILNTNEDIRVITVAYLMKALGHRRVKLEQILDKYLENQTYYYNVICWLDRILYAPRKFNELYRKQLSAKLDG